MRRIVRVRKRGLESNRLLVMLCIISDPSFNSVTCQRRRGKERVEREGGGGKSERGAKTVVSNQPSVEQLGSTLVESSRAL